MNDLKVFSNSEFGELGVLIIDGKEWFPAHQCAKVLGYSNPRDAVRRHCKSGGVVKHDTPTESGVQPINYINEGNLYRLIVSSKLPAAEKFERWVFDEVLPSIRHNGGYAPNTEDLIAKTATAVVSEVMKQLVPILTQIRQPQMQPIIMQPHSMIGFPYKYEYKPIARYCSAHVPSIIEQLDDDLKEQVHTMMASG
ncbi:MAG: hypothetical protein K2N36_07305, partial [Ruminiclostridium sp.]|nr:hypothetical protein [Ruminiclostridium sp.]